MAMIEGVTWTLSLLVWTLFAPIGGEVVVQPGYEYNNPAFGNPRINYPKEIIVQPGYERESPTVGSPQVDLPKNIVQPDYERPSPTVGCFHKKLFSDKNEPNFGATSPTGEYPQVNYPANVPVQPANAPVQPIYTQTVPSITLPIFNIPANVQPSQPVYGQPIFNVVRQPVNPTWGIVVQPTRGQSNCQCSASAREASAAQQQGESTLNEEIQRNKNLQQMVASQLYWIANADQSRQMQQTSDPTVGIPLMYNPLRNLFRSGSHHYSLTPYGLQGYRKNYGWGSPFVLRSASPQQNWADKIHYARSVDDGSRSDSGSKKQQIVATSPTIEKSHLKNGADLSTTKITTTDDAIGEKITEPRKIDIVENSEFDSPINRIHVREDSRQDSNPIFSTASEIVGAVRSIGEKVVDTVNPMIDAARNYNDPASKMSGGNYPRLGQGRGFSDTGSYGLKNNGRFGYPSPYQSINPMGYVPRGAANLANQYGQGVFSRISPAVNNMADPNTYLKNLKYK